MVVITAAILFMNHIATITHVATSSHAVAMKLARIISHQTVIMSIFLYPELNSAASIPTNELTNQPAEKPTQPNQAALKVNAELLTTSLLLPSMLL